MSFPFFFRLFYAGTFEFIRYRFLYRKVFLPNFIFCLSSFISILSSFISIGGPIFGPIRNDSIISVSAIQYRWIYTTYIFFSFSNFSHAIWNTRTVDSFIFFFRLSFHLSEWKQRNVSLWSGLHFSLSFHLYSYSFLRADPL